MDDDKAVDRRSFRDSRCAVDGARDKTIIDRIMLRFRPIAPKPTGAGEGFASGVKDDDRKYLLMMKKNRVKRKYVRVKRKNANSDINNTCNNAAGWSDLRSAVEVQVTDPVGKLPNWIDFSVSGSGRGDDEQRPPSMTADLHGGVVDPVEAAVARRRTVEAWITMECVTTGTCEDVSWRLLGYGTDEEKVKSLETDACPWFVTDVRCDVVRWVNLAFKRMVDPGSAGGTQPAEAVVQLVVKEEINYLLHAFSCRVRVVFGRKEKKMMMMTVPCDVWRMDFGGFAWRLDVEAALTLGPLLS